MATYAELQTNIANYFSRQDLTTTIQEAITRAIKHYEREDFWFTDASGSFVTTSGTKGYTISSTIGYASVEQVIMNYNNYRYEVDQLNYLELNKLDATQLYSQPSKWTQHMGMIEFYPIPNGSYTVSYEYVTKVSTLSSSADTNVFTIHAEDLIEARASWWVAKNKTQNFNRAQEFKLMESEALRQLKNETTSKKAAGKITPTQF